MVGDLLPEWLRPETSWQAIERHMFVTSTKSPSLILASASPRRRELLSTIGYPFEVLESGVVEIEPPGMSPEDAAQFLASLKAGQVGQTEKRDGAIILAADTVIDLDGRILGKPEDALDAVEILNQLGGRTHKVITGVCIVSSDNGKRSSFSVSSGVTMRPYTEAEIRHYVASGEPLDKAGAYAVQGLGAGMVASVRGCYNNVVGLPLCEVVCHLLSFGVPIDRQRAYCRLATGEPCPRRLRD